MALSLALLALASVAAHATETTTAKVLLPNNGEDSGSLFGSIVASVVEADSTVTTFAVACASGVSPRICQLSSGQRVIQGPFTWAVTAHDENMIGEYVFSLSRLVPVYSRVLWRIFAKTHLCSFDSRCKLDPDKDVMTCTDLTFTGTRNSGYVTETISSYSRSMVPVIITAGADKLATHASTGSGSDSVSLTSTATSSTAKVSTTPFKSSSTSAAMSRMTTQDMMLASAVMIAGGIMVL